MTSNRPEFPAVWDATMVSNLRSCPTRLRLAFLEHWKPKGLSVHLHAGKCYAHGLEVARRSYYEQGEPPDLAVARGVQACLAEYGSFECPPDSAKSALRTAGALEYYFGAYPLASDPARPARLGDRSGIEFSFAVPLPIHHPVSDEPLIYTGRADMVADFAGKRYIFDDKTTSQLGASWSRKWDLRSQFTGYCWASREQGWPVAGVLVRGVSILKTKYDTLQAITYRPEWQLDRWLVQTVADIARAQAMWEHDAWSMNLDEACTEYGGCAFTMCCTSQEPETWLRAYFERRRWDPLTRTETLLEEAP